MEFELLQQLASESSRANFDFVSFIIGDDKAGFDELFQITIANQNPIGMRGAAVVETICRTYPDMILPYVDQIISLYFTFKHPGVKRGLLKAIRFIKFSESQTGPALDLSMRILLDHNEKVASKIYAMDILTRIAQKYPEFATELILVMQTGMENGSAAYKAHAGHMISKLEKSL